MNEHKAFDWVKEVAWNILVSILYYIYCFVILLIFHFFTYRNLLRLLHVEWTLKTVAVYALVGATIMMIVRIVRLLKNRK